MERLDVCEPEAAELTRRSESLEIQKMQSGEPTVGSPNYRLISAQSLATNKQHLSRLVEQTTWSFLLEGGESPR